MKKNLLLMAAFLCAIAANLSAQSFSKAFNFGGNDDDKVTAVKTDAAGNTFICGFFNDSVNFNNNGSPFSVKSVGGTDGFLVRLDSSGAFQWVSTFDATGSNNVETYAMDVDPSGNIYLTGYFGGTMDFNSAGSQTVTASNNVDIFVVKFNNLGTVTWAKGAGSTGVDIGKGISVGTNGNVYITGTFSGTVDFDPDGGITNVSNVTSNGLTDVFVWKLTGGGNISWAYGFGGASNDDASDIRVKNGFVYTVGNFTGNIDFDPSITVNHSLTSTASAADIFIQKLDAQGVFIYVKQIGNAFSEDCNSIVVDQNDNLYLAGSFLGTLDLDPNGGTSNVTSAGSFDGYLMELDSLGDFQWATSIGGTGSDKVNRIALGEFNNLYAIGDFAGNMDINTDASGVQMVQAAGGFDIFSSKLSSSGNFISGFSIGGGSNDNGNHITIDAFGSMYLSGRYGSSMELSPAQPVAGSLLASNGGFDGFVAKYKAFSVGLNEISDAPQFALYPNPAQQMFYITPPQNFGKCTIAVYDAQGKMVMPPIENNGDMQTSINHQLAAGIYTVKLSGKTSLTKKLVIGL